MKYAIVALLTFIAVGCSRSTFPEKITLDVSITQDGPAPVPPGPSPPGPSPSTGLRDFVFNQVTANVTDYDKASKAQQLASQFREVANGIPTQHTGPKAICGETKIRTDRVLGTSLSSWKRATDAINAEVLSLYKSNRMRTDDQFKAGWMEIASGLEMVR